MQTSTTADQTLVCADCGKQFVWTGGEQDFYKQKGFNPPTRCPECRAKRKDERRANRVMTKITCSKCGKEDEVPFVPKKGTGVLCRTCFQEQRGQR
ncbi:zinc-binding protein [Candidatus Gottesmanbacteria bacterium]|nr:zinc-binding protein [Candidatus Gottesmanbacteria bacterium]